MCVLESHRNLGIAKQLLERAIEDAKKINVEEILHVVLQILRSLYESWICRRVEESAKEALARMHEPRQILRYRG